MNIRIACLHSWKRSFHRLPPPLLIVIVVNFLSLHSFAQTAGPLTGFVLDSVNHQPINGVSVVIKGSRQGTSTDKKGAFALDISGNQALLEFSYVGYRTRELIVQKGKTVTVNLAPMIDTFGAVVVTAFGRKERREAVVGSVTSIQPGELKIPASNLTNALAGKVAGVIAFQRSGQPGLDNSSFFIRGVTTLGYSNSPLILVDNIELTASDLARLQVDDIASFSILKDASAAALYGARGANGVILVTTKEGKAGKAKVELRVESAISEPTKNIELADPITYMRTYNEALTTRDPLATPFYSPNKIIGTQKTLAGEGGIYPYIYPATDWMKATFKENTRTYRANFSVSGGNNLAKYYVAGSYSRDNGILQVNPVNNFNSGMKFENYQLRANTSIKATSTTEVGVRLWGNFNEYLGPISNQGGTFATDLYSQVLHSNPVAFPAFFQPDSANRNTKHILFGNAIDQTGNLQANPYASLMYGYKSFSESRMSAQFEVNQNLKFITPGLTFFGMFSTNRYSYFDVSRNYAPFYYNVQSYDEKTGEYKLSWLNSQPGSAREYLSYNEGPKYQNSYVYMLGRIDYSRLFGKHNAGASLVGTRQQTLSGNAGSLQASLPNRNLGVSGRASYSYDNKYFVEFNFGYNGSEKFSPEHRFGFFPTVGAGWVVSNEKFWAGNLANLITRLKLRGSYGLVGNDAIGDPNSQRFFYLSNVAPDAGNSASFGTNNSVTMRGTTIYAYPNPDVTWETSRKTNLAAEITLFKKLNIVAEVYREKRYNILIQRGYIPVTVGIETTAQNNLRSNLGKASSEGIDLNINYRQDFSNSLWASVLGNLTITRNKVTHLEEPEYHNSWSFHTGQMINQPFGYIAERLFVDDKEARNSPAQIFGNYLPMGGDIKYRDINKDGVINQDDQVPIGLPSTPQIIYGFGFSVGYKNFDISAFFQGSARSTFFIDPTARTDFYNNIFGTAPFANNAQILKAYANDHWSAENQNLYALWPRLSTYEIPNNQQTSTWWLRNGDFIRLKSVEAGYTIPKKWSNRIFMNSARIYFSGLNLFTFSKFKLWDPELAGNGFAYPVQKIYNLGLKFEF
ncbi:SusC/RagA family TonB-linked outer membrane protein [Niastella vici]|uniref:SusC/RagA family TonB-linked outer membrane protein n=1 Tax=Niastella vici TaxID=1703345 RepID=A0A1V9FUJ0_9BACT|nr:TonB-dependent receptor [Niastella vici]OQP62023.1 SusC/RagA family TonB-linked outer membrane protein [Niastella vici]